MEIRYFVIISYLCNSNMKRLFAYTLVLLLIVSTIGVNFSIHTCGGELLSVRINDLSITTEKGDEMDCCSDDVGCQHCKFQQHSIRSQQHYTVGHVISVKPALSALDWFHGDLPFLYHSFITVEEGGGKTEFFYQSPYHSCQSLPHRGLRAPPVYC